MRQAGYRLAQFGRHAWPAPLTAEERAEVNAILTPALAALFWRMSAGEQAHSLAVLRGVQAGGQRQPELLQAALLHDVGKSAAPLSLAQRAAVVLAGRLMPGRAARWGQAEPRGWRRPFVTAAQHPAWGAEMCRQAGAPALTARLVSRHQERLTALTTDEDRLLAALQAADNDH